MKFVCDNCQAKYQIGDEKVAGKTVRMKCRRCGYEIRVRADATEGGSTETFAHGHEMEVDASIAPGSIAAPMSHAPIPQIPGPAVPRAPTGQRPLPRPTMVGGHSAPAAALAAPLSVAPESAPHTPLPHAQPPRSAPIAPASHTSARPLPAPRPLSGVPSAPRPLTSPRSVSAPAPARPVTRTTSSSSMAAVQPPQDSLPSVAPESHERDWYVGIRGTPTGPIHASEIRDRASAGDVDGDSLVWREGMAEWRALRTVPSLLAIIEAARAPVAMQETKPPVQAVPAPSPSIVITPGPAAAAPAVPEPAASIPFSLVQPRASTPAPAPIAATPAPIVAAPAHVEPPPTAVPPHVLADPFAVPAATAPAQVAPSSQNGTANAPLVASLADPPLAAAVEAPAAPKTAPANRVHADESDLDAVLGRKRATHPMAYAFIAAAAVFGGVAAWVLLSRPATQIVVVQAPPATTTPATPSATAEADRAQVEVGEVSTGSPQTPGPKVAGQARPKASGTATAAPPSAPIDTSGFVNNVPGPAQNGPSGSQAGGGGQLSQGEITAVVSQNQPLVKRKCWQPALEARPANGATNARVNGSITIGASGAVESASANGGERDFPGLAPCIASRMKGWKFPPSGGSTTVNVPFVFAGQ